MRGYHLEAVGKLLSRGGRKEWDQPGYHFHCFVDLASADEAAEAVRVLEGKDRLEGGVYRVELVDRRQLDLVLREQMIRPQIEKTKDAPKRDLEGDWRRPRL